jgi:hypothetical protein
MTEQESSREQATETSFENLYSQASGTVNNTVTVTATRATKSDGDVFSFIKIRQQKPGFKDKPAVDQSVTINPLNEDIKASLTDAYKSIKA